MDFESVLNDFHKVRVILLAVILMYKLVEHYSKANVVRNSSTVLVYQNVCYRCVHYGEVSSKATTANSRSLQTGCAARFNMRLEHGRLVSAKAVMIHNHPDDVSKAAMYRRNLRLDDDVQPIVAALVTVKPKTEALREVLRGKISIPFRLFSNY